MRERRRALGSALVGAALLLTAACSAGDSGEDGGAAADQTLVVGQTIGIAQLDPNVTTLTAERVMWNLLWDGLTRVATDGQVEPELAEDWEVSEDQLTWTFTLRDDVTFHDGRSFTAEDAAANLVRILDPDLASPQRAKLTQITDAVAVDETTLELALSAPMPQLPAALVDVKMVDPETLEDINSTANGTGPFMLDSFVPDQELVVVQNPDYWEGAPALDEVRVTKYADMTSAQSALTAGTIDVLWSVPFDQIASQEAAGMSTVVPDDPSQAAVLLVDNLSAPFDDPVARQALSYATDRETIQAASFGGLGELNTGSTLVSPTNPYAAGDLPAYDYDLERAADLFAEAGVTEGDSFICWSQTAAHYKTTCEILQQSLAEIGITLDIETNEPSTWAARFYPAGKEYEGLIVPNYLSREGAPLPFVVDYFGDGGWSETNWPSTTEYEEVKDEIRSATEEDVLQDAFGNFQHIMNEEQPMVSILNVAQPSMAGAGVQGVWMESNGTIHVESAEQAQ